MKIKFNYSFYFKKIVFEYLIITLYFIIKIVSTLYTNLRDQYELSDTKNLGIMKCSLIIRYTHIVMNIF